MIKIIVDKCTRETLASFKIFNERFYKSFKCLESMIECVVEHHNIYDLYNSGKDLSQYDYIVFTDYTRDAGEKYYQLKEDVLKGKTKTVVIYEESYQLRKKDFHLCHPTLFDYGFIINKRYLLSEVTENKREWDEILHNICYPLDVEKYKYSTDFKDRGDKSFAYVGRVLEHKFLTQMYLDILQSSGKGLDIYGPKPRIGKHIPGGIDEDEYNRLASKCNINYHGYHENIGNVLNEYKYTLLCSDIDILSMFTQEAMACGCIPIVYTRSSADAGIFSWVEDLSPELYKELTILDDMSRGDDVISKSVIKRTVDKFMSRPIKEQELLSRRFSDFSRENFNFKNICEKYIYPVLFKT